MAAKFSVGDVMQLKSGGPAMTISEIIKDHGGRLTGSYRCKWFKGASHETFVFEEETLQPYVAPKKA
jgi:uncharacterized protein YodC (DUF2158 family)